METPDLNSIDAEYMLRDMVRNNSSGAMKTVITVDLSVTVATPAGKARLSREVELTPEEVLKVLSERKAITSCT